MPFGAPVLIGPKCLFGPWTPQYSINGRSPQEKGKPSPILYPELKEPCMRIIWYYIPLRTIFPPEFYGYHLKTQFFHINSSHQFTNPF
ncbi:hypothetical protein O181_107400 [Austropuccinia psidii MF-1]|uniref:Uncharacterized protein n=1 Tax=Austropuccinia psidii MF-1 TaxID=1389203 RepID=A0A9Q3JUC9_9BASI|nr:hypothetical protein [Austropuccinia psidii MF-1]